MSSSEDNEARILFQADTGENAELVPGVLRMPPPLERVRWWQRAAWRLRPHWILCAATGGYLCRRYWRRQPLTVTSEPADEFISRLEAGADDD